MADEREAMDSTYDAVLATWDSAGLTRRRVLETPGWERADAAVRRYCGAVGWSGPPMGPTPKDTWFNWMHILSHCLADGHCLAHAEVELALVQTVISALSETGGLGRYAAVAAPVSASCSKISAG